MELSRGDIVRHPLVQQIVNAYEWRPPKRHVKIHGQWRSKTNPIGARRRAGVAAGPVGAGLDRACGSGTCWCGSRWRCGGGVPVRRDPGLGPALFLSHRLHARRVTSSAAGRFKREAEGHDQARTRCGPQRPARSSSRPQAAGAVAGVAAEHGGGIDATAATDGRDRSRCGRSSSRRWRRARAARRRKRRRQFPGVSPGAGRAGEPRSARSPRRRLRPLRAARPAGQASQGAKQGNQEEILVYPAEKPSPCGKSSGRDVAVDAQGNAQTLTAASARRDGRSRVRLARAAIAGTSSRDDAYDGRRQAATDQDKAPPWSCRP